MSKYNYNRTQPTTRPAIKKCEFFPHYEVYYFLLSSSTSHRLSDDYQTSKEDPPESNRRQTNLRFWSIRRQNSSEAKNPSRSFPILWEKETVNYLHNTNLDGQIRTRHTAFFTPPLTISFPLFCLTRQFYWKRSRPEKGAMIENLLLLMLPLFKRRLMSNNAWL